MQEKVTPGIDSCLACQHVGKCQEVGWSTTGWKTSVPERVLDILAAAYGQSLFSLVTFAS
jgi:hypothetical protein